MEVSEEKSDVYCLIDACLLRDFVQGRGWLMATRLDVKENAFTPRKYDPEIFRVL